MPTGVALCSALSGTIEGSWAHRAVTPARRRARRLTLARYDDEKGIKTDGTARATRVALSAGLGVPHSDATARAAISASFSPRRFSSRSYGMQPAAAARLAISWRHIMRCAYHASKTPRHRAHDTPAFRYTRQRVTYRVTASASVGIQYI